MFFHKNLQIGRFRDSQYVAVLLAAFTLGFLAYIARLHDVTHDAFHEMALARAFVESGQFPRDDIFAFTPTVAPTVHHEWGTGLVLYLVAGTSPLGMDGMAILRLVLIIGMGAALYRVNRNNGAHPLLIAVAGPIMFPLLWVGFGTIRAQIFSLLFVLLQLLLQQSDWRGQRRWVVWWFVLYVVWLNMHAGFVVGLGMLGFHCVERWCHALLMDDHGRFNRTRVFEIECWQRAYMRLWHHILLVPGIVFGAMLNPWGIQYIPYLIRAITMPRPTILEWQPLWMTYDNLTTMFVFALSVLALGYVARNRRWTRLRGWLFVCLAAYMALKHIRHGSIYSVVWLAFMPGWLTPTAFGRSVIALLYNHRTMVLRGAVVLGSSCGVFAMYYQVWHATIPSTDPESMMVYPVDALKFVKEHKLRGNMITPFACGAFVSWECYPDIRVSLDGRYEVAYRDDVLPKHDAFFEGKAGWEAMLDEYPADLILVQNIAPVARLLSTQAVSLEPSTTKRWRVLYRDRVFTLFGRETTRDPQFIQ